MDVDARLIEAIQNKRLAKAAREILEEEDSGLVRAAASVCANIRAAILGERNAVCRYLEDAGIEYETDDAELESPQIHQFSLAIKNGDPGPAVALLEAQGYRQPDKLTGAQWQVYRRTCNDLILTRVDEVTMRCRLTWRNAMPTGLVARFWPTVDDAGLVPSGAAFWPLAFLARPIGIVLRRLGISRRRMNIGEFLGTPEELVPLLLDFADISADDVVYDLGCGDGRILVEAAKRFACRTIGYEYDESLCDIARSRAEEQGVSHLVDIRCGDATNVAPDDAAVVLLFLPPTTVAQLVPRLLGVMPPGGRVIAHEQSPVHVEPRPGQSRPLFGLSALTVAHRWTPQQL